RRPTPRPRIALEITPMISPPPFLTVSEILPIIPTPPPPYTRPMLRLSIAWPSLCAASVYEGLTPFRDPQKTDTRFKLAGWRWGTGLWDDLGFWRTFILMWDKGSVIRQSKLQRVASEAVLTQRDGCPEHSRGLRGQLGGLNWNIHRLHRQSVFVSHCNHNQQARDWGFRPVHHRACNRDCLVDFH